MNKNTVKNIKKFKFNFYMENIYTWMHKCEIIISIMVGFLMANMYEPGVGVMAFVITYIASHFFYIGPISLVIYMLFCFFTALIKFAIREAQK